MKSIELYKKDLENISKDFIILKECEKRKRRYFTFKHINCGTEFDTDFSSLKASILKNNGGCPLCAKNKRSSNLNHKITKSEFNNYLKENNELDYTINDVWFDSNCKRSYVNLTHLACERSFDQRINDFKNRV